ncbi:hypothetical protein [Nocardia brasiliensis]|uniref:hypothetical protein n=1 Tax=Nocardia brasiliensis TaxID=37326 RepID=UPI0024545B6C|nr:hypothetical protein [Nocardia brasiliensis]
MADNRIRRRPVRFAVAAAARTGGWKSCASTLSGMCSVSADGTHGPDFDQVDSNVADHRHVSGRYAAW